MRIQPHGVFVNDNFGINRLEGLRRACHLERADPVGGMDDLALQVRPVDEVAIHQPQLADASARQVFSAVSAQGPAADDKDTGLAELLLPALANDSQDVVAVVTVWSF